MVSVGARPAGATASIGRAGQAEVVSATGGRVELSAALSPGFNPLDLLYASVAGCLVLSARIAASEMGVLDTFRGARADVRGVKAVDPPRIERLIVRLEIDGDFEAATRVALIARTEALCTVSNTLKQLPKFEVSAPDGDAVS